MGIALAMIVVIPGVNDEAETENTNGSGTLTFVKIFKVRTVMTLILNELKLIRSSLKFEDTFNTNSRLFLCLITSLQVYWFHSLTSLLAVSEVLVI